MSLAATDVCPGSVNRAELKEFVLKKVELLTPYYLRNLQQPSFLQDRLDKGVVKRATPLLNSICSNFVKQVAHFFRTLYRTLTSLICVDLIGTRIILFSEAF